MQENTFNSPKLLEVMKSFNDKGKRIEAYKQKKSVSNSLKINIPTDTINNH